jgi:hypothetical protein
MIEILLLFNNREIALGIWLIIIIISSLVFIKKLWTPLLSLLKLFIGKTMIRVLLSFFLYISLELLLLLRIGYWERSFLKDLIFWVCFVAFPYLYNFDKFKDLGYFKIAIKDNLKIILLLEFVSNSYAFNLTSELILFPIVCTLAMLLGLLEANFEERIGISKLASNKIKKVLYLLLNIYLIIVVVYSIRMAYLDFNNVWTISNFKLFLLPIILTVLFLPYLYILVLKETYNELFSRIEFFIVDKQQAKQIKGFIFQTVKLSLSKIITLNKGINYVKLIELSDSKMYISKLTS